MMKYISAEAFAAEMKIRQDAAKEWLIEATGTDDFDSKARAEAVLSFLCEVKLTLDSIPAADVKPVVRGKWIPVTNGRGGSECNQCHAYAPSHQCGVEYKSNYCPNCGAKMDGDA